jgi:hypothetical protein
MHMDRTSLPTRVLFWPYFGCHWSIFFSISTLANHQSILGFGLNHDQDLYALVSDIAPDRPIRNRTFTSDWPLCTQFWIGHEAIFWA